MEDERASNSNKTKVSVSADLLDFEHNASALEKRLLVWTQGNKLANASILLRGPLTTGPTPESSVLGRIKSFLPTLDEANRKLFSDIKANGAEQFNIESVTDADERYVQMDLALGVADLHTPEAIAAAELAANGHVHHVDVTANSRNDNSDSDSDDEGVPNASDMHSLMNLIRVQDIRQNQHTECQEDPNEKKDLKRKKIEQL